MININQRTKIGLIAGVLVLLFGLGLLLFLKNNPRHKENQISNAVMRILSDEDKKTRETTLAKLNEQAKNPPTDPEERYNLYLSLAGVNYGLGHDYDALKALDKIANDKGAYADSGRVWFLYANIQNDTKNFDSAMGYIRKAVDAQPDSTEYWLTYFGIASEKDPKQDLTSIYSEALTKTENAVVIVRAYARYLEFTGKKDQAIAMWQKAIEVDPAAKADYDKEIQRLKTP